MNVPTRPIATQPVRWRLRTKLLTLLLGITVLPLVFVTWIDFKVVRGLGHELAARTHAELSAQSRAQLALTADNYALLIHRQNELFESLVARQGREVELLLAASTPATTTTYLLDRDIDAGDPRLAAVATLDRRAITGEARPSLPPAYDTQVFRLPGGAEPTAFQSEIARLQPMAATYRQLHRGQQDRILWHYTSLENGLHAVYPGHGGYPHDYDPRRREWYQRQKSDPLPRWQPAQVDASTRQPILTFSSPLKGPGGAFAGVTAIDIPVRAYLESLPLPEGWNGHGSVLVVASPAADRGHAGGPALPAVLARHDFGEAGAAEQSTAANERVLGTGDPAADLRMTSDMRAGRNGIVESGQGGSAALWAYRRIGDTMTWLVLNLPHAQVDLAAADARDQALADTGREMRTQLALGVPLIALAVAGALLSARAINRPLQELVRATQRLGAGDFEARARITTGDELEMLGHAFNHMVPHLKERFRHAEGIRLAREVQQNLIPSATPLRPRLDLAGVTQYCEETGGDYHDYIELGQRPDDAVGIAIGDVSGHGISSALLMATARALLHAFARPSTTPAEVMTAINGRLADDVHQGRFMTLFYLLVAPETGTMRWVSAGHDPALLFRPTVGEVQELAGDDIPLGVDDAWRYREAEPFSARAGDVVLLGTDGVWDTCNTAGERFGKARLAALLKANATRTATEICAAVTDALRVFRGDAMQRDDLTVVVLRML